MKKIEFPKNSELKRIDKNAFSHTKIEHILIPSNVSQLSEGWCAGMPDLKKITVITENRNFICFEMKMILGKTNLSLDIYDKIVLVNRNIKEVKIRSFITTIASFSFYNSNIESIFIPSNITHIFSYAFSNCSKLRKVEFASDSKIQEIIKYILMTIFESCFKLIISNDACTFNDVNNASFK